MVWYNDLHENEIGRDDRMHGEVTIFNNTIQKIKFFSRSKTQGEELDMVERYVQHVIKTNRRTKTNLAIFFEPQLEFGYPDLVLVEYKDCECMRWNSVRENLDITDLKILYEIDRMKTVEVDDFVNILGYKKREIINCLKKLEEACLIKLQGERAQRLPLSTYSCVNKIMAIEAKIDKWDAAIKQAKNSYTFATEVYVLLNKKKCTDAIVERCRNDGLGIILVNGKVEKILKAAKNSYPVSYTSLLFNEWIQRFIQGEKSHDSRGVKE